MGLTFMLADRVETTPFLTPAREAAHGDAAVAAPVRRPASDADAGC
jgi:hypothetical protein